MVGDAGTPGVADALLTVKCEPPSETNGCWRTTDRLDVVDVVLPLDGDLVGRSDVILIGECALGGSIDATEPADHGDVQQIALIDECLGIIGGILEEVDAVEADRGIGGDLGRGATGFPLVGHPHGQDLHGALPPECGEEW